MKHARMFSAAALVALVALAACTSHNDTPGGAASSSGGGTCDSAPKLEKASYCETCTPSPSAVPSSCKAPRVVDACCTWLEAPTQPLARGTGLYRYSSDDPNVNLGCLDTPPPAGASQMVTLQGHVRLFSNGDESKGVKIEIFKMGADGALGDPVGTPATTDDSDTNVVTETYLKHCPDTGCKLHAYKYANVPTETRLVVKTSDATGTAQWAALYDYDVYVASSDVQSDGTATYDPSVVASTDIDTVASAAGGFTVKQDKGLLAGEVHDCGDVRLSGAIVDIDAAHEGNMFYFGENEADPLPDTSRGALGTSRLGLFGTLNVTTGVPIRLSAIGKVGDQTVLLGTTTVQTFPGAVTALRLRGRRPWQK